MRTIDATLTAALAAGKGLPIATAHVGYTDGSELYSAPCRRFKLTALTLELEIASQVDYGGDQDAVWLERGLQIAGTDYTVTTGRFFITSQQYNDDGTQVITASLFPKQKYTAAGDVTYSVAINTFCLAYGKTAVYADDTEAWLDYQFLPDGKSITMNDANHFMNMLIQKRLVHACDNGGEEVLFYSADVMGATDLTVTVKEPFFVKSTELRKRQYFWKDELEALHTDGVATDPIHNLGYLESTDSPPARHSPVSEAQAIIRPDLRIEDGDIIAISGPGGISTTMFAVVTEIYQAVSKKDPAWRMQLDANPIFHSTEGGALPSTIERVSNYTPLNTSMFAGILSGSDNNLQAAMDTIDDHDHTWSRLIMYTHSAKFNPADATSYFVGTGWTEIPGVSAIAFPVTIPRGGTITRIDIVFQVMTAFGTNETSSVYFRLNNTTDTLLSSGVYNNAGCSINATGLSIAVSAGDKFVIKWVTPTWATNPQGVMINAQVYIE